VSTNAHDQSGQAESSLGESLLCRAVHPIDCDGRGRNFPVNLSQILMSMCPFLLQLVTFMLISDQFASRS
jgi:hypothetical protein